MPTGRGRRRRRPRGQETQQLSEAGIGRLFRVLLTRLAQAPLPPPRAGQDEDAYTMAHIAPVVQETLAQTGVSSLLLGGHHTGINRPIRYLGMDLHPDLVVLEAERRLVAFEVKYLARGDRSGAFTKALGQAAAYRNWGYPTAAAVVIDRSGRISAAQIRSARERSGPSTNLATVLRVARGKRLGRGEILYPSGGVGQRSD